MNIINLVVRIIEGFDKSSVYCAFIIASPDQRTTKKKTVLFRENQFHSCTEFTVLGLYNFSVGS